MKQARLDRATLQGIELEYELWGTGEEPVVLVHHGVGVDWFRLLLEEPALTDSYRVLSYHRVGYGGSSRVTDPLDFEREAAHCRTLMRHLGIERAHIVGHSAKCDDCPAAGPGRPGGGAYPRASGVGAASAAE